MSKKLFAILAVLVFLAAFGGSAMAQNTKGNEPTPEPPATNNGTDETVPEDVPVDSLILPMLYDGDSFTDTLAGAISARLYVFNGSAGDNVTIAMTQISDELDPYLVLLGSAGEVIAVDDDSGDISLASKIKATLPTSGTYFLLATSYDTLNGFIAEEIEGGSVEFEMIVSGVTPPTEIEGFDPTRYTYFTGAIGMNETVEGYSTPQEPIYYYVFDGVEGETFDLSLESQDFDTVLHLFGSNGDRLAVNDDFDGTNSTISGFTVPVTGRYLIFATDYFFTTIDDEESGYMGGDFALSLTGSSASSSSSGTGNSK